MHILKILFDLSRSGRRPETDSRPAGEACVLKLARDREICRDELMTLTTDSMPVGLARPEHLRSCLR